MSQAPPPPSPDPDDLRHEDGPPERVDVVRMHAPILREQHEPRDGYEPVPFWLTALFAALLFWGGWYLSTYSGGFRGDVLEEEPPSRFRALQGGAAPDAALVGQRLFVAYCAACHQNNGRGYPGAFPPLAGSEWVVGHPARVKRILLHGLQGPINVRGQSYNSVMPSFWRLPDEHLAAILTYIRTNSEWGNSAGPIPPESVKATREATRDRNRPFTVEELLAVKEDEYVPAPATTSTTAP